MQPTWPYWCFLWASFNLSAQWSIAPSDIWQPPATGWCSVHKGFYPGWNALTYQAHYRNWDLSGGINAVPSQSFIGVGSHISFNPSHQCRWSIQYRNASIQSLAHWTWRQDAITQWHAGLQVHNRSVAMSLTMVSHGPSGWYVIIGSDFHWPHTQGQWTVGAMRLDGPLRSIICEGSGLVRVHLVYDHWHIALGWSPWGPSSSVGQRWPVNP